nr:hypothetical transcript [Hymenolepis microstoma]
MRKKGMGRGPERRESGGGPDCGNHVNLSAAYKTCGFLDCHHICNKLGLYIYKRYGIFVFTHIIKISLIKRPPPPNATFKEKNKRMIYIYLNVILRGREIQHTWIAFSGDP